MHYPTVLRQEKISNSPRATRNTSHLRHPNQDYQSLDLSITEPDYYPLLIWKQPKGELVSQPIHSLTYGTVLSGRKRTPLVMIPMKLNDSLHHHLLKDPMFSCNQSDLDTMSSLDRRVHPPVYIYEGYFHSMSANLPIYSRNPNPLIGVDFMKPPAADYLRAFYTTFRQVNSAIWDSLMEALFASARIRNQLYPEQDVCHVLASWIAQDRLFGDLSIQIHYGEGNDKNFPRGWHVDAENSLLHLAVTLRGSRVLHSKRCNVDHGQADEMLTPQHHGDVYLSSSALMLHAPKFSYASYDDRVIAIHARIIYTSEELKYFRKCRTEEGWISLTKILADHLVKADIQLPSLQQINDILVHLPSKNSSSNSRSSI
jgi:hypothetical protein